MCDSVDLLQVSLAEKTGEGKKVSLAFIPSPVFAARETCSKSSDSGAKWINDSTSFISLLLYRLNIWP